MKFEQFFAYACLAFGFVFAIYAGNFWFISENLRVSFLDVGQGDSILIQTPHNRIVLIDGGPSTSILERLGDETSFWLKKIDLLVLTHPDRDHIEGLLELFPRYKINGILMTGISHDYYLYEAFLEKISEKKIPVFIASPDRDWLIDDGVYFDVLAPMESLVLQERKNLNDTSVVARLTYGKNSILLSGDSEKYEEKTILLTDFDIRSQLLKSGHHGSKTSGSLDYLKSINPEQAIMMNGKDNQYGHPHLDTILRYDALGIDWLNTKDEGTVTYVGDGFGEWRREN